MCAVHQAPSSQKVSSIWTYMGTILTVHSYLLLCQIVPNFTYLLCLSKRVFQLGLYVPVYIKCIVTSNFQGLCPIFLTINVQETKKPVIKKWLCITAAVHLKNIVTSNFVWLSSIYLTLYIQYTQNPAVKRWLICAGYFIVHSNLQL